MADAGIPPPPPGYTLEGGAAGGPPPPPPGYTLEQPSQGAIPPPPAGYTMEGPAKPSNGSFLNKLGHDIHAGFTEGMTGGFPGFVTRHYYTDLQGVDPKAVMAAQQSMRDDAQKERQTQGGAVSVKTPFGELNAGSLAGGMVGGIGPEAMIPIPGGAALVEKLGAKGLAALAARGAVTIPGHAAVGAATDTGYQLLDMADGIRDHVDTDEVLSSAAQMAALGTVGLGVHAVAPHVKRLFADRKVDTTPAPVPEGVTTPLTGQGLDPEATQQYHEVLAKGTHQDIKNFFEGRNIEAPSHVDINEWIQRRDAVANNEAPSDYADSMFHPKPPDIRPVVADHVAEITKDWARKPDVEVINHTDDIMDPAVREQAKAQDADHPDAMGFYGPDGKVRIFANKLNPENPTASLHSVLYHEALGHFGLEQAFGDRLDKTLQTLMSRNVGQFGEDVKAHIKKFPGTEPVRAAEEVLAKMSEKGPLKPSIGDAISAQVRAFGRKMGVKLGYNDAEVREILRHVHQTVIEGKGRSVVANNFKTTPRPLDLSSEPRSLTVDKTERVVPQERTPTPTAEEAPPAAPRAVTSRLPEELSRASPSYARGRTQWKLKFDSDLDKAVYIASKWVGRFDNESHIPPKTTKKYIDFLTDRGYSSLDIHYAGIKLRKHLENAARLNPEGGELKIPKLEDKHPGFVDGKANVDFMRRERAAEPDYVARDLEGIYKSLDQNYVPETRSFADIKRSALEAGFSPSQIKDLGDVGDLSTKLHRIQAAANMADARLAELHQLFDTPNWTYAHQGEYLKVLADRDYLIKRIKGNRAEIARALNVSKMASSYSAATMKAVAEKLAENESGLSHLADDPVKFMQFIRDIKNMTENGNVKGARTKIENQNKPYAIQYVNSLHFNAMLSALSTHVKAPVDMTTGILHNVIEKALAIPVGELRKAASQGKAPAGITPQEWAAHTTGLLKGVGTMEVYRQMGKAVTGENHGGYVGPDGKFVPMNTLNQYGAISNPDLGPILSLPSHLIGAQDTFFRSAEMAAQLHSLGMRKAQLELGKKAGLDDLMQRAAYHALNPTEEMVKASMSETNRTLLLAPNKFNKLLDKASTYKPGMSGIHLFVATAIKTIFPFARVESNSLLERVIKRSPLILFDKPTRDMMLKGGPEGDVAVARMLYGTVAMGLALANADKVTGNVSEDPKKRAELLAGGVTPNSVHEDGHYNSSNNLAASVLPWDVHNSTAMMIHNANEAWKNGAKEGDAGTQLKLASYSLLHSLADMTWVSSLGPAVEAVTSDENKGPGKFGQFVAEEAKTFVPNILSQAARMSDHRRDTRPDDSKNISEAVARKVQGAIPGLSQGLPMKYSVYGEPIDTGASITGTHTIIPGIAGNTTAEPTNPQIKEMARLAKLSPAAVVTPVLSTIHVAKAPIKLTKAQESEYQRDAGQLLQSRLKEIQDSGQWDQLDDKNKIAYLKDLQREVKGQARDALIQRDGWINEKQLNIIRKKLSGVE